MCNLQFAFFGIKRHKSGYFLQRPSCKNSKNHPKRGGFYFAAVVDTRKRILIKGNSAHSTSPYFTLMRSSFSSMGSAASRRKITVAAA